MENASKALIMAGGVLIAILIISVLIYAWNLFSNYQSSRDTLSNIEDTAKFNLQFTNYDRDDVLGYELLSLLNKIVDYNERKSEKNSVYGNDEKYPPVSITITIGGDGMVIDHFSYDNAVHLFKQYSYTDNELTLVDNSSRTRHSFQKDIIDNGISQLQNVDLGGMPEGNLTSMAKNIRAIFKTEQEIKDEVGLGTMSPEELELEENKVKIENIKKIMIDKFNSYMTDDYKIDMTQIEGLILKDGKDKTLEDTITTKGNKQIKNIYTKICAYYEYMQFKRGIFECTKLNYDQPTGRVNEVEFTFTGDVK